MKYYYAQCETQEKEKMHMYLLDMSKTEGRVYIDDEETEENWKQLLSQMSEEDLLYIYDLSSMALDTYDLKEKLSNINERHIHLLTLDGREVSIEEILEAIEFTLGRGLYKQKKRQREGIQKALESKKKGNGKYGRPESELPEDFEENIRMIMRKQMSHETYRAKLNMKRSTYFKKVKELKDSWKTTHE